ncbi:MAG: hypothetical protein JSU87_12810 [Gemmatimonadota bacterium]|nr:MAG: hypothetical protein JSU87_12810 [Gemmatimonadota bacterium]
MNFSARLRPSKLMVVPAIVLLVSTCSEGLNAPNEGDGPGDPPQNLPSWSEGMFEEDFSVYGSVSGDPTTDFRNNVAGRWEDRGGRLSDGSSREEFFRENFFIRQDEIPGLGAVAVFETRQILPPGGTCKPGNGIGRNLKLPEPYPQEMWIEMWVKFSDNYSTTFDEREYPGCTDTTGGHKFIFFERVNGSEQDVAKTWRWKVGTNWHEYRLRGAGITDYASVSHGRLPSECFNGEWQRWRFHVRGASAPGVPDGHAEWRRVALDDPERILTNQCGPYGVGEPFHLIGAPPTDHHDGFDQLRIGSTMNEGPPAGYEQHWRLGPIRIYDRDPGWSW